MNGWKPLRALARDAGLETEADIREFFLLADEAYEKPQAKLDELNKLEELTPMQSALKAYCLQWIAWQKQKK